MPTSTPPADPHSIAVLHVLSRQDVSAADTYNALEGVRNTAGRNVSATIEANNARFEGTIKALSARF